MHLGVDPIRERYSISRTATLYIRRPALQGIKGRWFGCRRGYWAQASAGLGLLDPDHMESPKRCAGKLGADSPATMHRPLLGSDASFPGQTKQRRTLAPPNPDLQSTDRPTHTRGMATRTTPDTDQTPRPAHTSFGDASG